MANSREAVIAGCIGIAIIAVIEFAKPEAPPDPMSEARRVEQQCKLSEDEIRQLWARAMITGRSGDELNHFTAGLVDVAEKLCRDDLNRKPAPLPAVLQEKVRG